MRRTVNQKNGCTVPTVGDFGHLNNRAGAHVRSTNPIVSVISFSDRIDPSMAQRAKKRGRPPLPKGNAKTLRVSIPVNETERRSVEEEAAKAGLSLAAYGRIRLRLA